MIHRKLSTGRVLLITANIFTNPTQIKIKKNRFVKVSDLEYFVQKKIKINIDLGLGSF